MSMSEEEEGEEVVGWATLVPGGVARARIAVERWRRREAMSYAWGGG
jgi:hypothetical protein